MKLIKQLIEDAAGGAVGGGDVASATMPLLSSLVKRSVAPQEVRVISFKKKSKSTRKTLGLREAMGGKPIAENDATSLTDPSFDNTEVLAKLKSLENKEKTDTRDTTVFGLEDEDGNVVRVTVKSDQAEDFQHALQAFMSDTDNDQKRPEIAEMLFKLKDRFDIVDVQWPEIAEDEEEAQQLAGDQPPEGMPGEEGDVDLDGADDLSGGDDSQVKDLLTQVIDMMKADAEARKADARAREAEARGREADAAAAQAMARVKQEEQLLDMETYNKSKKEEEREAKRLAQLARWKHDMSNDHGVDDGEDQFSMPTTAGSEEEEQSHRHSTKPTTSIRGRVHPHDIADFILKRVK